MHHGQNPGRKQDHYRCEGVGSDERGREGMLKPPIVQEKHNLSTVLTKISADLPWWPRG
jgi:hypothetical protein